MTFATGQTCQGVDRRGMTLLEVILALTLSVGLVGSALGFYRYAVDVRRGIEAEMRRIEGGRMVMELITNELRSATVYKYLAMGVEGQADKIQFVSTAVPGSSVWLPRDQADQGTDSSIVPEHDLRIVGYGLQAGKDQATGAPTVQGLQRTCQKNITARVVEADRDIEVRLLSQDIKFINFRYWQDGQWLPAWTGGDLPGAVEITLGADPLPEGVGAADYPFDVLRRVVYLPESGESP